MDKAPHESWMCICYTLGSYSQRICTCPCHTVEEDEDA